MSIKKEQKSVEVHSVVEMNQQVAREFMIIKLKHIYKH